MHLHKPTLIAVFAALWCACSTTQSAEYQNQINQPVQISEYVREVFQDSHGNLWLGTNGDGVARYDGESLTYFNTDQGLAGAAIRGIVQDTTGDLWFATNGGVSRYDEDGFTNFTTENGLSNNQTWSIFEDSKGTIWVGTMAGVCKFVDNHFVPFSTPGAQSDIPSDSFGPHVVWSFFEDIDNNLWFGSDGAGAHKFDGDSFITYTTKQGLGGNTIRAIAADHNGNIWFGSRFGGTTRFDGTSFRNFTKDDGLPEDSIFEITTDSKGNIWFSIKGKGVSRYDGESFTNFNETQGLTLPHVQEIFEDNHGRIWLGCSGGLFMYDGESFTNITRDGPWPDIKSPPLNDWLSETIEFPPGFAPDLPTGKEDLRFPPGWRTPDSEEFWSYAILMRIDEPTPDAKRLEELLDLYYDGLMSAFSVGQDSDEPIDPAQVVVTKSSPNQYDATMHIIDGFATFKPIDIRIKIITESGSDEQSILLIRASPQPDEHQIWSSLQSAIQQMQDEQ